jgi:phage terminase large subunit GpA-like protein
VDYVTWSHEAHFRVVFENHDPATARIECPDQEHGGCGYKIYEPQRGAFVASGIWRATAQAEQPGLAGFHVPGMLSPWISLPELVERFLTARARGRESLKVFINTMLGEAWDDRTARMEAHSLMARLEDYGELEDGTLIEVPKQASALTAGVDVQAAGFLVQVTAWGQAGERWVVDWRTVPGDPKLGETRAALWDALSRRYQHASGQLLPIHATCIDSGYASDEVYSFVLAHQVARVYATKGEAGKSGEPLVWRVSPPAHGQTGRGRTRGTAAARKVARPVALYHVNVDDGKALVMASLALAAPGPNFIHFPARVETVDSEFFAQLCAEHRETRYNKGGVATHSVWVQDREANHALDAAVLSLVAFRILRPNIADMAQRIAAAGVEKPPEPPRQSSAEQVQQRPREPEPPPRPKGRRIWRSGYLKG